MIQVETMPQEHLKALPDPKNKLPFGSIFTDRMFQATYKNGAWQDCKIVPFGPILLSPAATVLHYAQEIFEGLKAYSLSEEVYLFRPSMNAKRFNASARRMCMPEFPEELFLTAIEELVRLEKRWIPKEKGAALYIRPIMIGTEPSVKVKPSNEYLMLIMLSPVGSYFKSGFKAVNIYVEENFHRACVGGTGSAKTGGNYAGSLFPTQKALKEHECEQVLWLDARQKILIEEVGAMNIWFLEGEKKLLTPALGGSILPGVNRDSLLKLGPYLGFEAEEQELSIDQIVEGIKSKKITEVFGSGTAAVISAVGSLTYKGERIQVGDGEGGPVARRLFEELTNIHYGTGPDPFQWRVKVC